MKLLFDLFPVILFFIAFKYAEGHQETAAHWVSTVLGGASVAPAQAPILLATVIVILATIAQIVWVHFRHGKVDRMLWISLGLVVFFGGLTLAFQNEAFIKWKPTILYWIFAGSLGVAWFFLGRNPLKAMLGEQIKLPEPVWQKLNLAWMLFFLGMGALNLVVAYSFSTDVWVNFKLFGGMGLMFVFILAQGALLSRYLEENA